MPSLLTLYEQLGTLHEEMADAAFLLDWDKVALIERKCSEITHTLQKFESQAIGHDERHRAADLIRHILEKQDLVRKEIAVWKTDVAPLLAVLNRSQTS